jgi:HEAT repeat protein
MAGYRAPQRLPEDEHQEKWEQLAAEVEALVQLKNPCLVQPVLQRLEDQDAVLRQVTVALLGTLSDPKPIVRGRQPQ